MEYRLQHKQICDFSWLSMVMLVRFVKNGVGTVRYSGWLESEMSCHMSAVSVFGLNQETSFILMVTQYSCSHQKHLLTRHAKTCLSYYDHIFEEISHRLTVTFVMKCAKCKKMASRQSILEIVEEVYLQNDNVQCRDV